MSENKYLAAALKYATEYGWSVFPVSPKTKKPLTPHGCKDAKNTTGPITAWWKKYPDAGIGIATGSASNLIVIDEDIDENKGLYGDEEVRNWELAHGDLPDTVCAKTGRGGSHLYYHYEGKDINNKAGLLPGVDVRGEGGYVVAPPSLHPNGTEYAWDQDPEEFELAELDDTVKEFLQIRGPKEQKEHFKVPTLIPNGQRNSVLFQMACSMQAQGFPDSAIISALTVTNNENCAEPVSDAELTQIAMSALHYQKGEIKVLKEVNEEWHEPQLVMKKDNNGEPTDIPVQTIANVEEAIRYDKDLFGRIRYNEIAYAPYVYGNVPWRNHKGWREWDNNDDSNLRSYIERVYGLKSPEKIADALNNVAHKLSVNPIKQMLEECAENWDGNKYVENLLPDIIGAEKTPYTTAVMRTFMLGAVSRIFKPGCKFDYVPILVGEQGGNKTTFCEFLPLNMDYYCGNLGAVDSDAAVGKLRGIWIVEMSEMTTMKKTRDVESIKSFITARQDTYRPPYGKRTEQRLRMCVFIGTSNPTDFLTDRTGNRRYLPIHGDKSKIKLNPNNNPEEARMMFAQAWGEIMNEYKQCGGKPRLVLPENLQNEALKAQDSYTEEDPTVGLIQEWLDTHPNIYRVCAAQIWNEVICVDSLYAKARMRDINAIHDIMKNSVSGWHAVGRQRCGNYGVQRCYERNERRSVIDVHENPFSVGK